MLTLKKLSHQYPNGVLALNQVDLEIDKGMFGLLGPNGAGKSTLMRSIASLQKPSSGEIFFDGDDIVQYPELIRKALGYLPQEFGVYPRGTAYQLLDHLAILKGVHHYQERKRQVEHLLVQTNLFEYRNRSVASFSGGMKQRFGIAQALLGRPKIIIVDEPTAGLDPEERNRFHNLLAEIGEDIVVILSTHIVEDVANLCPRLAILNNGEIQSHGTPLELTQSMGKGLWQKSVSKDVLQQYLKKFCVLSHHRKAGSIQIKVLSDRSPGDGFESVEPSLEDVYFVAVRNSKQYQHTVGERYADAE